MRLKTFKSAKICIARTYAEVMRRLCGGYAEVRSGSGAWVLGNSDKGVGEAGVGRCENWVGWKTVGCWWGVWSQGKNA